MSDKPGFDINKVIADARAVITGPAAFYQSMPRAGGLVEPLIFVAVMGLASGVVFALLSLVGLGQAQMAAAGFAAVVAMPIGAVIGSFIGAAILFVIWKLMGSDTSYETAYRCLAYATAIYPITALATIIPYVGSIVGVVWGTWLLIEASVAVHGRERRTATIVFGILGALMLVSNLGSEHAARQAASHMENIGESLQGLENLPPEEAGRKLGEFFKGMEQGMGKPAEPAE